MHIINEYINTGGVVNICFHKAERSLKAKYHHIEKASVYKNKILSKKIPGILTDNILRDLGPLE